MDSDDSEMIGMDLFLDKDYVEHTFSFCADDQLEPSFQQSILCLKAATTDYDLTGQILWPGCHALCQYIVDINGSTVQGIGSFSLRINYDILYLQDHGSWNWEQALDF